MTVERPWVTRAMLVDWLRTAESRLSAGELAVARVYRSDSRIAWHTLAGCTDGGWPGINVGQRCDCRYPTNGAEGLHAHVFDYGRVELHLDAEDVCRNPLGHAAADTAFVPGLLIGIGVGLLAGAGIGGAAGRSKGAGIGAPVGALAGAAIGGLIGANVPRGVPRIFTLDELARFATREY